MKYKKFLVFAFLKVTVGNFIQKCYNGQGANKMFDIEAELKKLPHKPGVYIMHDKDDKIIYVGKAISLKNRVTQYFRKTKKTKRT